MKINEDWKQNTVTCPQCNKKFPVKFEVGTNDNCAPLLDINHINTIFIGTGWDKLSDPEHTLQWLGINSVLFICPHCRNSFLPNESCRECGEPLHVWCETIGAVCSGECKKLFLEKLKNWENNRK